MIKSINTVRGLAIDSIEKANSGHPGICMGAAPMAYTLFNEHLKTNPKDSKWINRDRFILSAGHGSALLYSLLHLSGFGLTIDDLQKFSYSYGVLGASGAKAQGVESMDYKAISKSFKDVLEGNNLELNSPKPIRTPFNSE